MCTEVGVMKRGEMIYCQSVGELAKALNLRTEEVSEDKGENYCLCNAYLDKLGARKATDSEGWPFPEYIID